MHQYLHDTEFAVQNLIDLAHKEEQQLKTLRASLVNLESQLKIHQWDFQTSDMNDDFSDAYVMGAFNRMGRTHAEVQVTQQKVASLQASIGARQQATQAIAGAIFQIAKQGISLVHGGLAAAPDGRFIKSASLKAIIWQARNQAMHFEEGAPNAPVKSLFGILEVEQGPQFSLSAHSAQSRAKQVLDLLGWNTYSAYVADMSLLLPS